MAETVSKMEELRENISKVLRRIELAAQKAGRNPNEIGLISISKTFPVEILQAAISAGATDLGENKVQEGAQSDQAFSVLYFGKNLMI